MWHTDNNKTRKTVRAAVWMTVAAAGLAGCSKTEAPHICPPAADHYVTLYIKPVDVFPAVMEKNTNGLNEAEMHRSDNVVLKVSFWPVSDRKILSVEQPSAEQAKNYVNRHAISSSPKSKRIYDSLSTAHGDTGFFEKADGRIGQEFYGMAVFRRMTLDVVSDADYDEAHPAGTSLVDILNLKARSAREIIESGYDIALCPQKYSPFGYQLDMPLAQFNGEYRKLVDGQFDLTFTASARTTAVHRFTVIYRDEDGRTISGISNPVRLKGAQD